MTLAEGTPAELIERIAGDRLDAAFVRSTASKPDGLVSYQLLDEPLLVALPKGHPLAGGQSRVGLPLKQLSAETFVVTRNMGPMRDALFAGCSAAGFNPRIGQEAPHVIGMLPLVAAGIGISIVPASLQSMNIRGIAYRRLTASTHLKVPIILASRRGDASAVVRQFVGLVRRGAKNYSEP